MTDESRNLLKELAKSSFGRALEEFLNEEMQELSDLETITSFDDALGRRNAIRTIKRLFSFMAERKPSKRDPSKYI